jgi:5-formyltetrahydrofolate cyclo-ligase
MARCECRGAHHGMSAAIQAEKKIWRSRLREESARHSDDERLAHSSQICERIASSAIWRASSAVLFFAPMRDEPNLETLFAAAQRDGKTIALPRHVAGQDVYEAALIRDFERDLVTGNLGVREPAATCGPLPFKQLDLILVPGLGFNLRGARLGRGKGYYDRILADVTATRCGVAFDWQVIDQLPSEPHDQRLDCLATPSRWLDFRGLRTT